MLDGLAWDRRDGAANVAVADDGTLAYVPADPPGEARRLIFAEGWARSLLSRDGAGGS